MNITIKKPTTVNAQYIEVTAPVYTEDFDDAPKGFSLIYDTHGDESMIKFQVNLDTNRICFFDESGWKDAPDDFRFIIHTKVADGGTYRLLDEGYNTIVEDEENYVPDFFPGDHYGDYLMIPIAHGKLDVRRFDADDIQEWYEKLAEDED